MESNPCQNLYDDYIEAMNEWVFSSKAVQGYAATGPLDPHEDIEPIPYEKFAAALKREKAAHEE